MDGLVVCLTGAPAAPFNPTLVEGRVQDPASALAIAEALYPPHIGFGIEVHPALDGEVRLAALAWGLQLLETDPVLVVEPSSVASPPLPEGLSIERVTEPSVLDDVVRVDVAAFGGEAEVTRAFMPDAILSDPTHHTYAGRMDGQVVAAVEVSVQEGVIGVFGVATVPEARRRGIGSAMTAHAVREHAGEADLATLSASAMGVEVYERLGFETIMTREVWTRPRPEPSS